MHDSNTSCCDTAPAASTLTPQQARQRILERVSVVDAYQQIPLRDALNRTLYRDIISPLNVPSYDNSAMDGYALHSRDLPIDSPVDLSIIGTSWAGKPFDGRLQAGQCVRIMTGAQMPSGADTVIMQERVTRQDKHIQLEGEHQAQQNVRYAGEEITQGDTVLKAGHYLQPADIGLLATLGVAEIPVFRRLRVAFFSTGDELRSLGEPLEAGQIYDSNRYSLHALLTQLNVDILDLGIIRDTPEAIRQAFQTASQQADVLLTSGGVSVGDADYVKQTLEELGQVDFWKVAMKPGHPLAFGTLGKAQFFGLPGNPVSAMVTFYQFVHPALQRMMGRTPSAPLRLQAVTTDTLKKRPGRVEFQRGIAFNQNGTLSVRSTGSQGSHRLTSMNQANCFIVLGQDSSGAQTGDTVEIELLPD